MLQECLPEYAIPKFIRFTSDLVTTATLKIQKGGMKKEGYDITKLDDEIYIFLPGTSDYTPLTEEVYEGILNAKYNF